MSKVPEITEEVVKKLPKFIGTISPDPTEAFLVKLTSLVDKYRYSEELEQTRALRAIIRCVTLAEHEDVVAATDTLNDEIHRIIKWKEATKMKPKDKPEVPTVAQKASV